MNTQPPCPDPPLPPFPAFILDPPLHHSPQPPPSPALAPDEGGRGMGPQNLFRGPRTSAQRIRADPTPPPLSPPPPSPALAPHQGGRRRSLRIYFERELSPGPCHGGPHTYYRAGQAKQASSPFPEPRPPPPPPLPPPPPSPALAPHQGGRRRGPQNLFRDSNFFFERLAKTEPGRAVQASSPFPDPPPSTTPPTSPLSGRQTQGVSEFISRF